MIIICPTCSTRYSADPGAIGAAGRQVRCSKCSNKWLQHAVEPIAPAIALASVTTPEPEPAPVPVPPPEPKPAPEPEPEPEAQPEPEPEAAPEGEGEPAAGDDAGDPASPEEMDTMLDDQPEPEAVESLAKDEGEEAEDADDMAAVEDLPEPEPIPEVFTGPDLEEEEKQAPYALYLALVGIAVVAAIVAGLYFGRATIVHYMPKAEKLYAMAGISGNTIGMGLDIRNVKSEREVEDGADLLIVRGIIANVSEEPRDVPRIRVAVYDASDEEVLSIIVDPQKAKLDPKDNTGFKARLINPPPTARRLEVTFAEPAAEGGG